MSQQINLFNPIFKQQKKILSAVTMAQALGLILLGAAALSAYAFYRSSQMVVEAAGVTQQLQSVQTRLGKVNAEFAPRAKDKQLEQEIQNVENQTVALQRVDAMLHSGDLGNTTGYSSYMQAFARQIVDGVWLTGFSIYGAGIEIDLQGRALRPELVASYIRRLGSEPALQGKSFSTLEMHLPDVTSAKAAEGKGAEASAKPAQGNYIEFSLQSAGAAKQTAEAAGAKTK